MGVLVGSICIKECDNEGEIVQIVLLGVSVPSCTGLQLNRGGGGAGGVSMTSVLCRRNRVSGSMAKCVGRLKGIKLVTVCELVVSMRCCWQVSSWQVVGCQSDDVNWVLITND